MADDPDPPALLERLLADPRRPFALLARSAGTAIEVMAGEVTELRELAELTERSRTADLLVLVPYRQITERGYRCDDDESPLLALAVTERESRSRAEVSALLPDTPPLPADDLEFDVSDNDYQKIVQKVVTNEIGTGEGSNFVICRSLTGSVGGDPVRAALGLYRRLLAEERGAYWTFLAHTGARTFVGATPEAHLVLEDGVAMMNPISGTYRYPPQGPTEADLLRFLADSKENDELFMVVDEELKVMSEICESGAALSGPYLREMAHLAHTEYLLHGRAHGQAADLLRGTMFAPTVVGSPLENATRVIARYETRPRGYYAGVIAYLDRDARGGPRMDSAILIRTATIDESGGIRIPVGSTLVRDSDPVREMHESSAKAAAFVRGRAPGRESGLAATPRVRAALARRNDALSGFWFADTSARRIGVAGRTARSVLLLDAEDNFTAMLATMLRSLGLAVTIAGCAEQVAVTGFDLVVLGPGPGDPGAVADARVAAIRRRVHELGTLGAPFLAVCLSHQILCAAVGLTVEQLPRPNQGLGREITVFGRTARLGFYNAYVARSDLDAVDSALLGRIEVGRDTATGEVFALRGARFEAFQFHCESILSRDGAAVLAAAVDRLLPGGRSPHRGERERRA
ncbi:anthranilate synthase family protein [Nocardia takedensis]